MKTIVRRPQIRYVVLVLPLSAFAAVLLWSPYRHHAGYAHRLVKEGVDIADACGSVFAYLADSRNASAWSVFVDHITPLNPHEAADGARGSIRRSFKNADESGMTWDEYFELVGPLRRRLRIYNVQGVPTTRGELVTEQIYEPLGEDACRLSFTLFFRDDPGVADQVLMRLSAYEIARIFRRNIGNIKRLNEAP